LGHHLTLASRYTRYAVASVIVHSGSLFLVTGGLLVNKWVGVRLDARWQRRTDRIAKQMVGFALSNRPAEWEEALFTYAQHYPTEFLKVWENSVTTLKGSARERVLALLLKTGLDERLRAIVVGSDPGRAIWAISLLRELSQASLEAVEAALHHPAEMVRASACFTLAAHGSQSQQEKVLALLPALPFWQRIVVFQQIPAESPALEHYLSLAFRSPDRTVVLAALEFVLSRQRIQPAGAAKELATAKDLEVRIKFFKALPLLATAEDSASLAAIGLADEDWRVRAMAARACGSLHLSSLAGDLASALSMSKQPAEIGHIARALVSLGHESLLRRRAFADSDDDMTRAVTTEVLEKALLSPGGSW
ncbi:MAG: hypothetical protein ACRD5L_03495, partial [Bryobacteraceae bacterium]